MTIRILSLFLVATQACALYAEHDDGPAVPPQDRGDPAKADATSTGTTSGGFHLEMSPTLDNFLQQNADSLAQDCSPPFDGRDPLRIPGIDLIDEADWDEAADGTSAQIRVLLQNADPAGFNNYPTFVSEIKSSASQAGLSLDYVCDYPDQRCFNIFYALSGCQTIEQILSVKMPANEDRVDLRLAITDLPTAYQEGYGTEHFWANVSLVRD